MKPLIDADILRYELGYAAEVAANGMEEGSLPSWDLVQSMLHERIGEIEEAVGATAPSVLYITEGATFRDQIAVRKPYKGTRVAKKPWHFDNLTLYMKEVLGAVVCRGIEADDAMTIEHVADQSTIVCSRDKDLRQVPGWFYSWELGKQPAFGPVEIDQAGSLTLIQAKSTQKLTGTGTVYLYSQILTGDSVDNIPGLPQCGPVKAYNILSDCKKHVEYVEATCSAYREYYGPSWEAELIEQGRLCYLIRNLDSEGKPVHWEIGMPYLEEAKE
jgi:hypothetical protein